MRFENGQGNEQVELGAVVICPDALPKVDDVLEWELSLEEN